MGTDLTALDGLDQGCGGERASGGLHGFDLFCSYHWGYVVTVDTMIYIVLYKKMCPKHGLGQNLLVLRNAYSSSGKKPAFWINMVKQYF